MTDNRVAQARQLAEQAAEAGGKFSAKSPTGAEVVALASIALSLSVIAEAMAGPAEAKAWASLSDDGRARCTTCPVIV